MRRYLPRKRSVWADHAMVAFVTASSVVEARWTGGGYGSTAVVAAAVAGVALLLRNRRPVATTVTSVAAAGGWGLVLPLLVTLFALASRGRYRLAVAAAVLALAVNTLVAGRDVGTASSLLSLRSYGPALLLTVAFLLGVWADNRRRLVSALDAELAHAHSEREMREASARLSERARIAAEMHDVLAHRLSVIALHTGVLAARGDGLPDQVRDRIALLRHASSSALVELRDVLGALRDSETGSGGVAAPTLRSVADVVADARSSSGQVVVLHVDGDSAAVPTAHQLAVLRVVQESLTNARKHAGNAQVAVDVCYGPPVTSVVVENQRDEAMPAAPASGFGLIGLQERVGALGGEVRAGGQRRWRVCAEIPSAFAGPDGAQ